MDWNGQLIFSMQVASLYRLHCVNNYMQAFVYVCMYVHSYRGISVNCS